jgi:glycosyltransferase involved in cell wall biosynthesis
MPDTPLVSIIINCYNGEKFLKESLDSVIAQTYQNWEIIFWDNQSSDSSSKIVNSYKDKRIKYFLAGKHTVLYEARNLAIEKSLGEYLAFLDVDDYWASNKLEEQMAMFKKEPTVTIVYSNYFFKNELKNTIKISFNKNLPTGMILDQLLKDNFIGILTVVVKLENIEERNKLFNPAYHIIGDYDMAIRIASVNRIACIQKPLATYRWHSKNESFLKIEMRNEELEKWSIDMKRFPNISNSNGFKYLLNEIEYSKAMVFVYKGDLKKAIEYLLKLNFGIEKFKLLIGILLPLKILKLLRT